MLFTLKGEITDVFLPLGPFHSRTGFMAFSSVKKIASLLERRLPNPEEKLPPVDRFYENQGGGGGEYSPQSRKGTGLFACEVALESARGRVMLSLCSICFQVPGRKGALKKY